MIILPSKEYNNPTNEKITTYQFLSNVGCPVFDSVLFDENEPITKEKLITLKEVLQSEYCTIRYHYVKPSITPIRGGNKSNIDLELEALCKVAVVSSAKNGGIFTINPKINLNTENSSKLLELAVKGSDPSAYLGVLDNVFDIKIIVQDKDGKETYSDTFKISDVIEIISQISNTVN